MAESFARMFKNLLWPPRLTVADQVSAYTENLASLQSARVGTLTEEEYSEVRAEMLDALASFPKMYGRVKGLLAVVCYFCVVCIIYGLVTRQYRFVKDPIVPLAVASLIWWCQGRERAVKRALSRDDRLEIVNELARRKVISPDEAAALRTRIERLFENKRGA